MQSSLNRILLILTLMSGTTNVSAQPGQIPQIPAFLPMMTTVPASEAQPIDGIWTISSIGKRIRIEGGRAYAVDPWVHMFVLKIQPGMVVLKDIRPAGHGSYAGSDLPLMGAWNATIGIGGTLDVQVTGMIPARYQLLPMQLDNPAWFQESTSGATTPPDQPSTPRSIPVAAPVDPISPVEPAPVMPPPTAVVPGAPDAQPVSCREVVYREETDDFACVQ